MSVIIPTRLKTAKAAKEYILGGRALVTLTSNVTNKFFTYKITVAPNDARLHFVWYHSANGYRFVGSIKHGRKFFRSKKSIPSDYVVYKAFVWAWRHISNNSIPKTLAVYHNNTCRRCGRKLTTPKSMKAGIGPECIKYR